MKKSKISYQKPSYGADTLRIGGECVWGNLTNYEHHTSILKVISSLKTIKIPIFWGFSVKISQIPKIYPNLRFFIGKNIFSQKCVFFRKTSLICSLHTKYDRLTPKTQKVMLIFRSENFWLFFIFFLPKIRISRILDPQYSRIALKRLDPVHFTTCFFYKKKTLRSWKTESDFFGPEYKLRPYWSCLSIFTSAQALKPSKPPFSPLRQSGWETAIEGWAKSKDP